MFKMGSPQTLVRTLGLNLRGAQGSSETLGPERNLSDFAGETLSLSRDLSSDPPNETLGP